MKFHCNASLHMSAVIKLKITFSNVHVYSYVRLQVLLVTHGFLVTPATLIQEDDCGALCIIIASVHTDLCSSCLKVADAIIITVLVMQTLVHNLLKKKKKNK